MAVSEHGNDAKLVNGSAKAAHVNMMTDTIIANMSAEGLRSVMRSLLGTESSVTTHFQALAAQYLAQTRPAKIPDLFYSSAACTDPSPAFFDMQSRWRCLMGCGYGFESMEILCEVIRQTQALTWNEDTDAGEKYMETLALVDGDIVQAVTSAQKELFTASGAREMSISESDIFNRLQQILLISKNKSVIDGKEFVFERGLSRLGRLGGSPNSTTIPAAPRTTFTHKTSSLETFRLGSTTVPRMFMGLWQFSSPAWGTASRSKINKHFRKHVDAGFTAYDMADHYGDAEVTFGQFRSSQSDADKIFCATKWCPFEPIEVTEAAVEANITERLTNINADSIELLQFHWQEYKDRQYVKMAHLIGRDRRVQNMGLVNFDTQRMNEVLDSGANIVSNQVQFSLIDLRPTFQMAESCRKHNVKLLTYGSLCGGFLADKWLGASAPSLFDENMTPSHRKYLEMIMVWGGWDLFQHLLSCLAQVAEKYNVSISNVAVRWVLDHDYVGAVIVGARMGISEHVEQNLRVFSFTLDEGDQLLIQGILDRSKARDVFEAMGDCGSEYRL